MDKKLEQEIADYFEGFEELGDLEQAWEEFLIEAHTLYINKKNEVFNRLKNSRK